MESFRTELELVPNVAGRVEVQKDILDLAKKIQSFQSGLMPEEKFRSLRLARGVYGQRQKGVQMVRIKLPYGKMTLKQWHRMTEVSDEYATGNLHLTTRQDIQIHFVSLDRTPSLWNELEKDQITLREACGNTVRNITASDTAGIDPNEPFDVTPYAHGLFEYFLRNPICQELGRKFKIAFSNTEEDRAYAFMHDIGVIAKVKTENGKTIRGFKVMVGGGLGAQPLLAHLGHEFLEEDLMVPYVEAVLRVFDRQGERNSRNKARMKYLIQKIGFEAFTQLVEEEKKALPYSRYKIQHTEEVWPTLPSYSSLERVIFSTEEKQKFDLWKSTNVFSQKQKDFFAVWVRIPNGDIGSEVSRRLIKKLQNVIADDVRITVNQGLQFRFVKEEHLDYIYQTLLEENLGLPGFSSPADVTGCPGTDTCNLGISNSTYAAIVLGNVVDEEYPQLLKDKELSIKISGCMNSCGQHSLASIGFHGSSMKVNNRVMPALQVMIGGGVIGDGYGRAGEKVLKVPTKRSPEVLRIVLNDYLKNRNGEEKFIDYSARQVQNYYYQLLKPTADITHVKEEEYLDWGHSESFATEIGVGECAGVMIDLVATLVFEAEEKITNSEECFKNKAFADSIYHAYSAQIGVAKGLLLRHEVQCNTHIGILNDFDKTFVATGLYTDTKNFKEQVLRINENPPTEDFAIDYLLQAKSFLKFGKENINKGS